MSEYKLKVGEVGQKVIDAYQKIEDKFIDTFLEKDECGYSMRTGKVGETVVNGFKKIEDSVIGGYQAIEDGVVNGYKKVEDKFVDAFLEEVDDSDHHGETK